MVVRVVSLADTVDEDERGVPVKLLAYDHAQLGLPDVLIFPTDMLEPLSDRIESKIFPPPSPPRCVQWGVGLHHMLASVVVGQKVLAPPMPGVDDAQALALATAPSHTVQRTLDWSQNPSLAFRLAHMSLDGITPLPASLSYLNVDIEDVLKPLITSASNYHTGAGFLWATYLLHSDLLPMPKLGQAIRRDIFYPEVVLDNILSFGIHNPYRWTGEYIGDPKGQKLARQPLEEGMKETAQKLLETCSDKNHLESGYELAIMDWRDGRPSSAWQRLNDIDDRDVDTPRADLLRGVIQFYGYGSPGDLDSREPDVSVARWIWQDDCLSRALRVADSQVLFSLAMIYSGHEFDLGNDALLYQDPMHGGKMSMRAHVDEKMEKLAVIFLSYADSAALGGGNGLECYRLGRLLLEGAAATEEKRDLLFFQLLWKSVHDMWRREPSALLRTLFSSVRDAIDLSNVQTYADRVRARRQQPQEGEPGYQHPSSASSGLSAQEAKVEDLAIAADYAILDRELVTLARARGNDLLNRALEFNEPMAHYFRANELYERIQAKERSSHYAGMRKPINEPVIEDIIFHYNKAAEYHQPEAMYKLGHFYLSGSMARLKKNLANKIFGYLARCDFWAKIGLRFWILVG